MCSARIADKVLGLSEGPSKITYEIRALYMQHEAPEALIIHI